MTFHDDWGVRSPRWRGVRSEWLAIDGTAVHLLRADGPGEGVPQLLVHGLGGAATNWLEVLPGLARLGPVVAPDLPGFGRTPPPRPGASRVVANARFLAALLQRLGWERAVVHGSSMGGMVTVLLSELAPERLARVVLVSPALPTPRRRMHQVAPRTLLRFAPFAVPGVGRLAVAQAWTRATPEQLWRENLDYVHADPARVRPELRAVGLENVAFGHRTRWRRDGLVAAAESLVAQLLRPRRLWEAVDGLAAPTLLLWGEADRLVSRAVVDELARRRPDWDHQRFAATGHCPHVEVPERYVEAVAAWLAGSARTVAG